MTEAHILVVGELFSDGGEVHGLLDDLPVSRDGFLVDGREKGPSVLMGLQLSQKHSGENKGKNIISDNFDFISPVREKVFKPRQIMCDMKLHDKMDVLIFARGWLSCIPGAHLKMNVFTMKRSKVNSAMHAGSMCLPARRQPICVVVFGCFGFFHTGDGALMDGLGAGRAVVSFSLFELLGTLLWHAVAAGSLLFDELSHHRWLTVSFYLTAFFPSSSCSAQLLPTPRGLTTLLNDRTHRRLVKSHTKHNIFKSINWMCTCATAMLSLDN